LVDHVEVCAVAGINANVVGIQKLAGGAGKVGVAPPAYAHSAVCEIVATLASDAPVAAGSYARCAT